MPKKNGRPSFAESMLKRRQSGQSWDDKTIERIDCVRLLDRLQQNSLGQYQQLREAGPAMFRRVLPLAGVDWADLDAKSQKAAMTLLEEMVERLSMDMAAVKSAEICLRKVLPDLAQVEQKNTTNNLHVVMMPGASPNAETWAETARLSATGNRLEAASWTADAVAAVPD